MLHSAGDRIRTYVAVLALVLQTSAVVHFATPAHQKTLTPLPIRRCMEKKGEGSRGTTFIHVGTKKPTEVGLFLRLNLLRLSMTQIFCYYGHTRLRYLRLENALVLRLRRVFRSITIGRSCTTRLLSGVSVKIYFSSFIAFVYLWVYCTTALQFLSVFLVY